MRNITTSLINEKPYREKMKEPSEIWGEVSSYMTFFISAYQSYRELEKRQKERRQEGKERAFDDSPFFDQMFARNYNEFPIKRI